MERIYKFSKLIAFVTIAIVALSGCEKEVTGEIAGCEYVDLGLPSGLMWATCNIGASSPEDYGNYYAWSECSAAVGNLGSKWRMPSRVEWQELIDECDWAYVSYSRDHRVSGYKVTGSNGNSIFLPAAGYRNGSSLSSAGEYGYYWSSTPSSNDNNAYYLNFYSSDYYVSRSDYRYYGQSVRPVIDSIEFGVPTITTNAITEITPTTAVGGGNVINEGDAAVTSRGVCWSTSQNPTIGDAHTTDGSGEGEFTSNLTGLTPNTTYYLRAYATNSEGTSYGVSRTFTTLEEVDLPTVTTNAVTEITQTTAVSGGNVTNDGGAEVTARGVCWSTSQNPTIGDAHTTDGGGEGEFTSNLTGLTPNTTYYLRAYATNSEGTSYGVSRTFTTLEEVDLPTVTTNTVTEITQTTAVSGGYVVEIGDAAVTSRGVCWSTSQNPTISDNHTTDGSGEGEFTSNVTGLMPNTTYYLRAYATNEGGTGYGEEYSFTTTERYQIGGYDYVDLGLPSGLKWATCNIGASSPEEYGNYYAWGETEPKSTYTSGNSITYGVEMEDISGNPQYDAATANWGSTWRMPTEEECEELVDECTWQWTTQNGVYGRKVIGPNGNHIFLPAAGYRLGSSLKYAGERGDYWSSTPSSNANGAYYLFFSSSNYYVNYNFRDDGRSVRPVSE